MEIVNAKDFEMDKDPMPDLYKEFRDREGVPVHEGVFVKNVNELETDYWERTGQAGALINLYGTEGVNDLQIHSIEPGGETEFVHTFYDEIVYATAGNGLAIVGRDENQVQFEWGDESLFYIPQNVPYKYVNLSDEPARLIAQTSLPQYLQLYKDIDFYLNPPLEPSTKYNESFFKDEGKENLEGGDMFKKKSIERGYEPPMVWETNFIPEVSAFDRIESWSKLGAMSACFISFTKHTTAFAHISQFAPGQYKVAHRHNPGAHLFIRSGEGYSLMWDENSDEILKTDWGENSVFVPPAHWFHHHFNLSDDAVRQVVMHPVRFGTTTYKSVFDTWRPVNRIEYVDEDPLIRDLYRQELESRGLELRMPDECYENPDFEF